MPADKHHEVLINVTAGIIIFMALTSLLIFILLFYQRKRFAHKEKLASLSKEFSEELFKAKFETQEQTFLQISRELHDNFGHIASLIKINLNTLNLEDTDKATAKIEDTKDLSRQLIADIKSLSVSLNSDRIAQTGLVKALQTEVERLNKTDLFTASFTQTGPAPEIENDKAIILYRMSQEILNNMVKHSGANCITVNLSIKDNLFILAFSDDGKGFDMEEQLKSGGSGLTNLQKRAALINAQLIIQSGPGNGTHIAIQMSV